MMFIQLLKRSLRGWWNHLVHLTLLNIAWLVAQILVVTAPPATATLYVVANQVAQGELISARDVWITFRAMFIPAWKWAACNLIVLLVLASYLLWARTQTGAIFGFVGVLVLLGLILWVEMNLLYWPLWIAQEDTGLRTTFRNAFVIVIAAPLDSLLLFLASAVLIAVSALIVLPLIHFLMVWLALLGANVAQALIKRISNAPRAIS
ncbi:MAG TPA: DUF624 domain-containing protein [Phototrophicaceae bacterium]|nr:DUF624 domain-containing protein [Phototrophicaceae bacterium]